MRSTRPSGEADRPVAIASWIGDDGEPIEVPQPTEPTEGLGEWLVHQIETAGEVKAAPGKRLGLTVDRARRTGSSEEVVAPLLIRPRIAMTTASRGEVFDHPLRRMQIHLDSLEASSILCTWSATLRTGVFRKRKATLRIGPSPSGNLTVIQLVPLRTRRYRTRSFVRAGVPAIRELSNKLVLLNVPG